MKVLTVGQRSPDDGSSSTCWNQPLARPRYCLPYLSAAQGTAEELTPDTNIQRVNCGRGCDKQAHVSGFEKRVNVTCTRRFMMPVTLNLDPPPKMDPPELIFQKYMDPLELIFH